MDCQTTKERIAEFLSGALTAVEVEDFLGHVGKCPECKGELQVFEASWKALGTWRDLEPDPGYVPRFWAKLAVQTPWYQSLWAGVKPFFLSYRITPVLVTLATVLILTQVTVSNVRVRETEQLLTSLSKEEIEFMESLDIVEQMDTLDDMELLKDLESMTGVNIPT